MGREAKAKGAKEIRVKLTKDDYYELRALLSDIELIQLKAQQAAAEFKERIGQAVQAKDARWAALVKQYNVDPKPAYRLDDQGYELVSVPIKD